MKTEDKIGEIIQQLVLIDKNIERLEYMGEGATQPEMLGAYHQQKHEEREKRRQLRAELLVLKQMHRAELADRKTAIEAEMDLPGSNAWDVEEMREMIRNIDRKIEIISEEIKQLAQ